MEIFGTRFCCQLHDMGGLGDNPEVLDKQLVIDLPRATRNLMATTNEQQTSALKAVLEKHGFNMVAKFPSSYGYFDALWIWIHPATESKVVGISDSRKKEHAAIQKAFKKRLEIEL